MFSIRTSVLKMYDYSKLTIIIPTLNEAKNIKILIGKLILKI